MKTKNITKFIKYGCLIYLIFVVIVFVSMFLQNPKEPSSNELFIRFIRDPIPSSVKDLETVVYDKPYNFVDWGFALFFRINPSDCKEIINQFDMVESTSCSLSDFEENIKKVIGEEVRIFFHKGSQLKTMYCSNDLTKVYFQYDQL